jgi:hypothetical protein
MSNFMNKAGMKLFAHHLEHYTPADPLYEEYVDKRGRTKRRKRQPPPGLSDRDTAIIRSVNRRAHYLDKGFNLCGIHFGWSFIIGIIPVVGDAADAILGYFLVIRKARKADIPWWLTQRMIVNLAIASSVGLVPIVGDVALAAFRANSRNAILLEEFLRHRAEGVTQTTGETGATAERGINLRDEPRTAHEADIDDGEKAPPVRKRPWRGTGGVDDKGAGTSALPEGSPQHRDSRFVEDVT